MFRIYHCSKQLKPLHVLMEGKPAAKSDQDPVLGPVERVITLFRFLRLKSIQLVSFVSRLVSIGPLSVYSIAESSDEMKLSPTIKKT